MLLSSCGGTSVTSPAADVPPFVSTTEVTATPEVVDAWWLEATTVPTVPSTTIAAPSPPPLVGNASVDGTVWDSIAMCECRGNWGCNTGNGFGGGLQFAHQASYSTWLSFGGGEFASAPWDATREQQIAVAERVLAASGWRAWPGCARKLGLL